MTFRYARHSQNINELKKFYIEIAGLESLGGFENHNGYDGVFLGIKGAAWHLEFTKSEEVPQHTFDPDDILVFYVDSKFELVEIQKKIQSLGMAIGTPKNPYWVQHGIMVSDPDGHPVMFCLRGRELHSEETLTQMVKEKNILDWSDFLTYVRSLPYGRNSHRGDFALVLKEGKGTCSSKHALVKKVADENGIGHVRLILGMYKMNKKNTPAIGDTLEKHGFDYIPEAHCYLKINNRRLDITSIHADMENIEGDILEEIEITPEQVSDFKVEYHKKYLERWLVDLNIPMTIHEVWAIREECIRALES